MPAPQIAIIILAAGRSSRLGRPKQLMEYRGHTLIHHAVESALNSSLRPIIVVTSPGLVDPIRKEVADKDFDILTNTECEIGMSSSIRMGLSHAVSMIPEIDAVILGLCDQPHVTSETFTRLAEKYRNERKPIVASEYSDTLGVPALFDRSMFDELLALTGDRGAKSLFSKHAANVARVASPEAAFDIDSAEDLKYTK